MAITFVFSVHSHHCGVQSIESEIRKVKCSEVLSANDLRLFFCPWHDKSMAKEAPFNPSLRGPRDDLNTHICKVQPGNCSCSCSCGWTGLGWADLSGFLFCLMRAAMAVCTCVDVIVWAGVTQSSVLAPGAAYLFLTPHGHWSSLSEWIYDPGFCGGPILQWKNIPGSGRVENRVPRVAWTLGRNDWMRG